MSKTYKEFTDKLKEGHIYVPEGKFNPSTVLGVALVNKVCEKENIDYPSVHRVSDEQLKELYESKDENIIVSYSASDIADVVEYELYGNALKPFIIEFDLGSQALKMGPEYEQNVTPYVQMINSMNPLWDETFSNKSAFDNAVRIVEQGLTERYEKLEMEGHNQDVSGLITEVEKDIADNRAHAKKCSLEKAEKVINNALNKTQKAQGKNKYEFLNLKVAGIPYDLVKEVVKASNKQIAGYTFPTKNGITYKPLDEKLLSVPEKWKSASLNELDKEVKGMTYCHKHGISITFTDGISETLGIDKMIEYQEKELSIDKSTQQLEKEIFGQNTAQNETSMTKEDQEIADKIMESMGGDIPTPEVEELLATENASRDVNDQKFDIDEQEKGLD